MDYLLYAFHGLVLVFWVRLWSASSNEFHFNPFLSGTVRFTDSVFAFLRPVLFLPEQAAAAAVVAFTLGFKAALLWHLNAKWSIDIGTLFLFMPRLPATPDGQFAPILAFSAAQFAVFMVRLWTVYLLVRLITPSSRVTRATDALAYFSRPFSRLPIFAQPFALLALHALLALFLTRACASATFPSLEAMAGDMTANPSTDGAPFLTGTALAQFLKVGWLAALSFADGFKFMMNALFVVILGSLGAAVLQARNAMIIFSEAVELLLGRFARKGSAAMGIDFTPIIFIIVVNLMYGSICQTLHKLIHSPFLN